MPARPGAPEQPAPEAPVRIADAQLSALVHRTWLASDVREIDGWLVRRDRGATRRANSVLPHGEPVDTAMAFQLVEALYRQRGLPPRFVLGPDALPAGLDDLLAERGYTAGGHAYAMVAQIGDVLARAGERTRGVHVSGAPDGAHLDLWGRIDGRPGDELGAIATRTPAVYASMRRDGRVWAVGRGTLDGDWCGIDGLATDPQGRRQGLATDLIAEIARRAHRGGARGCWLLVTRDNPARALYERLGFTVQYAYHYRTREP